MSRAQRRAHLQPDGKPVPQKPKPKPAAVTVAPASDGPPDLSDADVAFGHRDWRTLLPPREEINKEDWALRSPFARALSSIFFNGGRLEDHGISPKPGVDMRKVYRFVKCTLGDFGPSHEHKIGGIAHMLAKWCTISSKTR